MEVALKFLRPRYRRDGFRESRVARFVLAQGLPTGAILLPHEGFMTSAGDLCLAYHSCGRDLCHWMEMHGAFSEGECRELAAGTLRFLKAFHRLGAAHTDIKPENFLYDTQTSSFRLIDFGSAERNFRRGTPIATREYTPPEGIIGGKLTPAVDIWSLACTIFEILTGRLLFDPHAAAASKYVEFDRDGDEEEKDSSESHAARNGDRYEPGEVISEKYRLLEEIGDGKFAVVWRAEVLDPEKEIDCLSAADPGGEESHAAPVAMDEAQRERERTEEVGRRNRKRFGVDDMRDLALNYEHLVLMQGLLGPIPPLMANDGMFGANYFKPDGELKFDPFPGEKNAADSIAARLRTAGFLPMRAAEIEEFLLLMLRYSPHERAGAAECLAHPWLRGV